MTNNDTQRNVISQWAHHYLSTHGFKLINHEAELVKASPWSMVMRFLTTDGHVYLKHMPRLIALEPIITMILQKQFHASVPEVIAIKTELDCYLMKDAGYSLRLRLKRKFDFQLICQGIDQFTSLQASVANDVNALIDAGVPDWRMHQFPDLLSQLFLDEALLMADGLSHRELIDLQKLHPKVSQLCIDFASYAIKETIVQPDFSDNNMLVDDKLNITLIDLGEVVISHPFFSLINCLYQIKKHHGLKDTDETYIMIRRHCFNAYMNDVSGDHLNRAIAIAEILWFAYAALGSYRLMQACGPKSLMLFQPGKLCRELKSLTIALRNSAY